MAEVFNQLNWVGFLRQVTRSEDKGANFDNGYHIGRLLSPRDEAIDLTETEWLQALALTKGAWHKDPGRRASEPDKPNGPAVRCVRGTDLNDTQGLRHGLLLLYPLDPKESKNSNLVSTTTPIIGMAVSFPSSELGTKIPYSVNNVAWELQYGSAE